MWALKLYMSSVLIWTFILLSVRGLTLEHITENGWYADNKRGGKIGRLYRLIVISAIPLIRFLAVIGYFYCAGTKKGDYENRKEASP